MCPRFNLVVETGITTQWFCPRFKLDSNQNPFGYAGTGFDYCTLRHNGATGFIYIYEVIRRVKFIELY